MGDGDQRPAAVPAHTRSVGLAYRTTNAAAAFGGASTEPVPVVSSNCQRIRRHPSSCRPADLSEGRQPRWRLCVPTSMAVALSIG